MAAKTAPANGVIRNESGSARHIRAGAVIPKGWTFDAGENAAPTGPAEDTKAAGPSETAAKVPASETAPETPAAETEPAPKKKDK